MEGFSVYFIVEFYLIFLTSCSLKEPALSDKKRRLRRQGAPGVSFIALRTITNRLLLLPPSPFRDLSTRDT